MFSEIKLRDRALKAGEEIMKIYKKDVLVEYKEDASPLNEADLKSNEIICSSLEKLYPNIPILSEENTKIYQKEIR